MNCLKRIPIQAIPIATRVVLLGIVSFAAFNTTVGIISCLLGWSMLAITIEDAKLFIIPDIIGLPVIAAGLIAARLLSQPLLAD